MSFGSNSLRANASSLHSCHPGLLNILFIKVSLKLDICIKIKNMIKKLWNQPKNYETNLKTMKSILKLRNQSKNYENNPKTMKTTWQLLNRTAAVEPTWQLFNQPDSCWTDITIVEPTWQPWTRLHYPPRENQNLSMVRHQGWQGPLEYSLIW